MADQFEATEISPFDSRGRARTEFTAEEQKIIAAWKPYRRDALKSIQSAAILVEAATVAEKIARDELYAAVRDRNSWIDTRSTVSRPSATDMAKLASQKYAENAARQRGDMGTHEAHVAATAANAAQRTREADAAATAARRGVPTNG